MVDVARRKRSLKWQEVQKLDEQRSHPRIPLIIKTAFITDSGRKFSAEIINVSPDGLQMRCSINSARYIVPLDSDIDPPCANTVIPLPVGQGTAAFSVRCQTIYLRTMDTDNYCVVGMRFIQIDPRSERILDAFLADQLMYIKNG